MMLSMGFNLLGAKRRLAYIFIRSNPTLIELVMGLAMLGWAIILLVFYPGLLGSPSYKPLRDIVPQEAWGWIFLIGATVKLVGLYMNQIWLRLFGSFVGSFVWTAIAMSFLFTGFSAPTGLVVYGLFALASWRVMITHAITLRNGAKRTDE